MKTSTIDYALCIVIKIKKGVDQQLNLRVIHSRLATPATIAHCKNWWVMLGYQDLPVPVLAVYNFPIIALHIPTVHR